MELKRNKIFWVIITILLGALGSGLWELAVKPIFSKITFFSLTVVTLGLKSLRNDIYVNVAMGFYEMPSLTLNNLLAGIFSGMVLMILLGKNRLMETKVLDSKKVNFAIKLTLIFIAVMLTLMTFRSAYINQSINHFEQLNAICAPYMKDDIERLAIRSRFSNIQSREDYIVIIDHLRVIAKDNNIASPDFAIF